TASHLYTGEADHLTDGPPDLSDRPTKVLLDNDGAVVIELQVALRILVDEHDRRGGRAVLHVAREDQEVMLLAMDLHLAVPVLVRIVGLGAHRETGLSQKWRRGFLAGHAFHVGGDAGHLRAGAVLERNAIAPAATPATDVRVDRYERVSAV